MTKRFTVDFNFEGAVDASQPPTNPVVSVGVRYLVDGENILLSEEDGPSYLADYLPNTLRKWLNYVEFVNAGETRTFEFTDNTGPQIVLSPENGQVSIEVIERHSDHSEATYKVDFEEFRDELVRVTREYINWILGLNPKLESHDSITELRELVTKVPELEREN